MKKRSKSSHFFLLAGFSLLSSGCHSINDMDDCSARVFEMRQQVVDEQVYENDLFLGTDDPQRYKGSNGKVNLALDLLLGDDIELPPQPPQLPPITCD